MMPRRGKSTAGPAGAQQPARNQPMHGGTDVVPKEPEPAQDLASQLARMSLLLEQERQKFGEENTDNTRKLEQEKARTAKLEKFEEENKILRKQLDYQQKERSQMVPRALGTYDLTCSVRF